MVLRNSLSACLFYTFIIFVNASLLMWHSTQIQRTKNKQSKGSTQCLVIPFIGYFCSKKTIKTIASTIFSQIKIKYRKTPMRKFLLPFYGKVSQQPQIGTCRLRGSKAENSLARYVREKFCTRKNDWTACLKYYHTSTECTHAGKTSHVYRIDTCKQSFGYAWLLTMKKIN